MNFKTYLLLAFYYFTVAGMHTLSAADDRSENQPESLLDTPQLIDQKKNLDELELERFKEIHDGPFSDEDICYMISAKYSEILDYMLSENERLYPLYLDSKINISEYYDDPLFTVPLLSYTYFKKMNSLNNNDTLSFYVIRDLKAIQSGRLNPDQESEYEKKAIKTIAVLTKHGVTWDNVLKDDHKLSQTLKKIIENNPRVLTAMSKTRPGAVRLPIGQIPEIQEPTLWDRTKQTWKNIKAEIPKIIDRMPNK